MGRMGGSGETKEQKPAPLKLLKARQGLRGSAVKIVVKKNGKFQHVRTGLVQPPVSTSSVPGAKRPKRHQSIKAPFPNREERHFNFGASEQGILLLRRLRLGISNFGLSRSLEDRMIEVK